MSEELKLSDFDIVISEFVTFHSKFRESTGNEDELLEYALEYPEKLGKSKGITFVIMIDAGSLMVSVVEPRMVNPSKIPNATESGEVTMVRLLSS